MQSNQYFLPEIGDLAPPFAVDTQKGAVDFPAYSKGCWCVFFAHPANFTSCWAMFSAFLGKKERWLNDRNTKVLALCNEEMPSDNEWSEKARRFIGIYMNAPVIEDLDFRIARMYGLASGRRPQPGLERLALIIDPDGVIRMIINRPLPNIVESLDLLTLELDRLQGLSPKPDFGIKFTPEVLDQSDLLNGLFVPRPAHFPKKKFGIN